MSRVRVQALLSGVFTGSVLYGLVRRDLQVSEELLLSRLSLVHRRLTTGDNNTHHHTNELVQEQEQQELQEQTMTTFTERMHAKLAQHWNYTVLNAFKLINDNTKHL
jgi:hypothetical protein